MPAETPLPQQLKKRDQERLAGYAAALAFYQGNQWDSQTPPRRARRLTLNYVRAVVSKTASYVMQGAAINASPRSDGAGDVRAAAAAEQSLAEVSHANGLPRLDLVSEVDAAVLGDGAYKVTWDTDDGRVAI